MDSFEVGDPFEFVVGWALVDVGYKIEALARSSGLDDFRSHFVKISLESLEIVVGA